MSGSPRWGYVQARLQARHGERLQEGDWLALEAARSFDSFVERVRSTAMSRFAARIHPRMSSHAVERLLREAWRAHVAEVAGWVTGSWSHAVAWLSHLPELPLIDAVLRGDAPDWLAQDPAFAALLVADDRRRPAALAASALAPLIATADRDQRIAVRWHTHWRALWPRQRAADLSALFELAGMIAAHFAPLDRAGPQQTGTLARRTLTAKLIRLFRRHSGAPAAAFCHLALVALDLERLRGGLVRRRLFESDHATDVA